MAKSYLAFDLGASSGRGIIGTVVNGKLELNEIHRFKNFPSERNGHFYWDFNSLLNEIKTGIVKACKVCKDISSFSIDTWGVDYVLFRDGKMVRDPYCYRDARTDAAMEALHKLIPAEEIYAQSGIQIMSFNTIYQLYAHKTMHPEDFEGNTVFLNMPDALMYMLTGEVSSEYTMASTGAIIDPVTKKWNFALLEKAGIPAKIFPKIVMPSTRCLPLKKEICEELNVPAILGVKVGSHDTASAVAATPSANDPKGEWAYISSGTWALLGAELDEPFTAKEAFEAHYTNEGGLLGKIRFLTNIMGTWLLQETKRNWNEAGNDVSFAEMETMAASVKDPHFRIDPNDHTFFTPGDMPQRIRDYCKKSGQGDAMTDAELLRCIYDSLALCFRDKISDLEKLLGKRFKVLHILGGAIKDKLLMQLSADATNLKIATGPVEATAAGNLLSQMIAAGELSGLDDARRLIEDTFEIKTYLPSGGKF